MQNCAGWMKGLDRAVKDGRFMLDCVGWRVYVGWWMVVGTV